jgi:hypothetical protein
MLTGAARDERSGDYFFLRTGLVVGAVDPRAINVGIIRWLSP